MTKGEQIAILTGAASGIGLGIVEELLREGFYCCVVDANPSLEDSVNTLLDRYGRKGRFICEDTSDWASATRVFAQLKMEGLRPNLLVNNVSPRRKSNIFEETEESWDSTVDGSLKSCFTYSREFVKNLNQNEPATIVNIGSVCAELSTNQSPSYHVSKIGVEALTRYFAVETKLLGYRLTVNCLRLGLIVQDRHRGRYFEDSNEEYRKKVSMYLFGENNEGSELDVAKAILFLAGTSSRFINGTTIVLDGGGSIQEQLSLVNRIEYLD
jgi:3-oxoacyl-[acyl-carrier protein] reductase